MNDTTDFFADEDAPRRDWPSFLSSFPRLRMSVSRGGSPIYPLAEVLLLLTCATIAPPEDAMARAVRSE